MHNSETCWLLFSYNYLCCTAIILYSLRLVPLDCLFTRFHFIQAMCDAIFLFSFADSLLFAISYHCRCNFHFEYIYTEPPMQSLDWSKVVHFYFVADCLFFHWLHVNVRKQLQWGFFCFKSKTQNEHSLHNRTAEPKPNKREKPKRQ